MRQRILKRGMWNIADVPLVVSKWSPIAEESTPEATVPLWVHLKNVPMSMFSWEGLSFMTSAVGFPDRLHPETVACTNFEVAKVFVNADLEKDFPKAINFTIDGKVHCIEYVYPWLPSRCDKCGKWGHLEQRCGQKKKSTQEESLQKTERRNEMKEGVNSVEKLNEKEEVQRKGDQATSEKVAAVSEVEEGQIENEWLDVTPGKAGRNSEQKRDLKYGEVRIISSSRFSALSILEGEEELEENEKVNEESMMDDGSNELQENKEVVMKDKMKVDDISEDVNVEEKQQQHVNEVVETQRQRLPRQSKTNHKVVTEVTHNAKEDTPSKVSKKKNTRKKN